MSPHMTNFRGEDMPGRISHAVDSPPPDEGSNETPDEDKDKDKDKEEDASKPQATAAESSGSSEVPQGTTTEILHWVGDDKERAQAALDAENNSDRPRSGLTSELNKILGSA